MLKDEINQMYDSLSQIEEQQFEDIRDMLERAEDMDEEI